MAVGYTGGRGLRDRGSALQVGQDQQAEQDEPESGDIDNDHHN
jgi:hypothetical protein